MMFKNDEQTVSRTIDEVAEGILACYKELIEIAEELDDGHDDEIKSVCGAIVGYLHRIKPLDY
ncbi:hypothetical protein [Terrihalobacillus insolitus]|uniref:hypothetical protein n=1 Tax=Terrihalobacillus insolitus TaxID=2950438 RepID=UPI0023415902|nr:hypothetical protein [Terrihalobacillus insolitus]MDC3412500.1 hypothetical protein [Terrihalobacillus insolitus]